MINSNSTVIYYQVGAYGTFIEWCLNYFTDENFSEGLPFTNSGSSHNFISNEFITVKKGKYVLEKIINDPTTFKFLRLHPGHLTESSYNNFQLPKKIIESYLEDIENLAKYTKNIIILYYNKDSILWGLNNSISKIIFGPDQNLTDEYIKQVTTFLHEVNDDRVVKVIMSKSEKEGIINSLSPDCCKHTKQWGHESFEEFADWELREFLSLYMQGVWNDVNSQEIFDQIKIKFPFVKLVEISCLKNKFHDTIKDIVAVSGLPMIRQDKIDFVYQGWLKVQKHINKDQLVQNIVDSILNNTDIDWSNESLSLYDEAEIQRRLADAGWSLRCFNLNQFPTNSKSLRKIVF